jgi:two-component system chemotaxis response regulator CheB
VAIRVLIADDSETVRERLAEALSPEEGFEVVGTAGEGRQAAEMCRTLRPDVVSMDMMMPVMSGLAATEY